MTQREVLVFNIPEKKTRLDYLEIPGDYQQVLGSVRGYEETWDILYQIILGV